MLEKVRRYVECHHMLEMGDRVVAGISGGADSVCLFLLLLEMKEEYGLSLFVVHVHHGIRKEAADGDAEYVQSLCREYDIPFYLFKEDIPKLARAYGMGEEETGRQYRYHCFNQVMAQVGADKIATAHHMGDQAETVLFHLIRGTNLSGMTGIAPVNGKMIRPLLSCQKKELVNWLVSQNAVWREDATNTDNHYARNKLRNQVIPTLEEINEQAVTHIAELAGCLTEYEKFFQKAVHQYIEQHVTFKKVPSEYDKKEIRDCETSGRVLREQERVLSESVIYEMIVFVCGKKKDISREHIKAVYGLLYKQSGKKIVLPYQTEAEVSYEKLIIRKNFERKDVSVWNQTISVKELMEKERAAHISLPDGGNLTVQVLSITDMKKEKRDKRLKNILNSKNDYTKLFDCDTIKDTLYVRMPEQEDYFIMNEKGNRKKLSRYFIDNKIPQQARKHKIVIADGHEILWIIGGRRCETYKINNNTKHVLLLMYEGEKG